MSRSSLWGVGMAVKPDPSEDRPALGSSPGQPFLSELHCLFAGGGQVGCVCLRVFLRSK